MVNSFGKVIYFNGIQKAARAVNISGSAIKNRLDGKVTKKVKYNDDLWSVSDV